MSTTTCCAASVEDIVTVLLYSDRGSNLNLGVPLSNKRIVFLLSYVVTITHFPIKDGYTALPDFSACFRYENIYQCLEY